MIIQSMEKTYLLKLNHCIYLGSKKNDSLACPNQMRLNNVHVDKSHSSLFPNSTSTQCLIVDNVKPPLQMKGHLSYLDVRHPSLNKITDDNLQRFIMTNPHGWDPYGTDLISTNNVSSIRKLVCHVSSYLSDFPFNVMNL